MGVMAFKDYLFNNLGWKLLSLLFAVLIWLVVHSSKQGELRSAAGPVAFGKQVVKAFPVALLTSTASTHRIRVQPATVQVTLSGDLLVMERLRESDVEVFVRLVDAVEAPALWKRVQVRVPAGVDVLKVEPPQVRVDTVSPSPTASTQSTD